jgi:uncharacterized membrane protein YagU involved in acid resistance
MNSTLAGAASGLAATLPMTVAMETMFRELPLSQRYPLPPRKVAMEVAELVGADRHMAESERHAFTVLAHFGYGTVAGAAYGGLARKYLPGVLGGMAFGLGVWAGSYLAWLPAADMHRPATQAPPERNALMIAAHLVWGAALGAMTDALLKNNPKSKS